MIPDKSLKQKAFEFATCLLAFFLPLLPPIYFSYLLILWSVLGLIFNFEKPSQGNVYLYAPIGYFLMLLVGLIFTESQNIKEGWKEIEKSLSFLIVPLIFYFSRLDYTKLRPYFFISFTLGNLTAVFLCWSIAIYKVLVEGHSFSSFFYHELASPLQSHATYFSFFLVFNLGLLIYLYKKLPTFKGFYWVSTILFIGTIFALQARITIIGMFLASLYYIFDRTKVIKLTHFLFVILVFVLAILLGYTTLFTERFKEVVNIPAEKELVGTNYENGVTQRIFFWKNGLNLIKKHLPWGTGTGDNSETLSRYYVEISSNIENESIKKAILSFATNRYNLHNQYLHTLLQIGIPGLILLLWPLGLLLKKGLEEKNDLMVLLFLLTVLVFTTEVFFARQKGIVFFAIFYSFLMASKYDKDKAMPIIKQ